jgi:hypothetical protein
MIRPCFAVDRSIFSMAEVSLPVDAFLRVIDLLTEDVPTLINQLSHGSQPQVFLLGYVVPAKTKSAQDKPADALQALLPEALRAGCVFQLSKTNERSFVEWCWQRFCLMSDHLLREYARAHLALAAARDREQRLGHALAAAEAAFVDFRKEPLKLALRLPPSGVYARPAVNPVHAEGDQRFVLRQEVSTLLANVIYLDLFFNRDGAALAGNGRLVVATGYSGHVICEQEFAFSEINQGWQRFWCFSEELIQKQPLHITLELTAGKDADLMPSLSDPTPLPREAASIVGGSNLGRPLALQIWTGIAGISYPRHINALAPPKREPQPDSERFSLPADLLANAKPYQVGVRDLDFSPVSYQEAAQSLLVHPLGLIPTVAKLASVSVTGLRRVSALVNLDGPEAKPTDFAIVVMAASERPPRFEERRPGEQHSLRLASWLKLHGGEWGEAAFTLSEPLDGLVDFYLLAKNDTEAYHLSWAFFRGITLECVTLA